MAKKFQELVDKMSPEGQAKVKERTEELNKEMEDNDPYVYVDGKKEMADGSGMVKESEEDE